MSVAIKHAPMTLEEFLAWESKQETRYEFNGVEPVDMTGNSHFHSVIQTNLLRALGNQLAGKPCHPVGSESKLRTSNTVRYPDAMVICRAARYQEYVIDDPTVVFEILSDTTAQT